VIWQLCTQKLWWHPLIWLMDGYEHEIPYSTVSSWEKKCMMFLCRDIIEVPKILKKSDQYLQTYYTYQFTNFNFCVTNLQFHFSRKKLQLQIQ
jgi:hypothetical protein